MVAQDLFLSLSKAQKYNGIQLRRGIGGKMMFQAIAKFIVLMVQYQFDDAE